MPAVHVVPAEKKGKFKVLVNYLQQGSIYSSRENAEHQAEIIRKELSRVYK